jgi:hypothetical protein
VSSEVDNLYGLVPHQAVLAIALRFAAKGVLFMLKVSDVAFGSIQASVGSVGSSASEVGIREKMRKVMQSGKALPQKGNRRKESREAYPYPVYLTPVNSAGMPLVEDTVVVLGKQISELGFDFYHRDPLPYRRVIVSFETGTTGGWTGALLDLSWCRFGRHGWYDNGGRFLAIVPSPFEANAYPSLID